MNGVLLFAFNNKIDYFAQANWCADRINQFLDLPVTIVTDPKSVAGRSISHDIIYTDAESGGHRLYNIGEDDKAQPWFNAARYRAYELSPYDQTLVLDTDYIVCSDVLRGLFDQSQSLLICRDVFDPTNRNGFKEYQYISNNSLRHWWATIMYFKRSYETQTFFDYYNLIKKNYKYFADLYQFRSSPFRNDFVVSIAINTMWGHVPDQCPAVPWSMCNVSSDVEIEQLDHGGFELQYLNQNKPQRVVLDGIDFHFMNKKSLEKLYVKS